MAVLGRLLEGPTAVGNLVRPRTLRTKLRLSGASKRGQSATYGAPERLLLSIFYPTKTSNDSTPNKQTTNIPILFRYYFNRRYLIHSRFITNLNTCFHHPYLVVILGLVKELTKLSGRTQSAKEKWNKEHCRRRNENVCDRRRSDKRNDKSKKGTKTCISSKRMMM